MWKVCENSISKTTAKQNKQKLTGNWVLLRVGELVFSREDAPFSYPKLVIISVIGYIQIIVYDLSRLYF